MPTPYAYKPDNHPAYPDFIADVLEADRRDHPVPYTTQTRKLVDALKAIRDSLAEGNDEPLNDYATRYFHGGQS